MAYAARGPQQAAQGYAPVTTVAGARAYGVGDWATPVGWRPKPYWFTRRMADGSVKGVIQEVHPPEYVRVGAGKGGKRVPPPKHLSRVRLIPKIVTPTSYADEQRLLCREQRYLLAGLSPCIPLDEAPVEILDMLIDAYGPADLPPDAAELCRARMLQVEREKKAKPARGRDEPTLSTSAPRAGRAPAKRRATK